MAAMNLVIWARRGAHVKLLTGMFVLFLGLKFGQILFFWVGKFFSYFSGFRKISAIFFGSSNFCITHFKSFE